MELKKWHSLSTFFVRSIDIGPFYDCNKEILKGLGEMYLCDERFAKNINKNGEGTAELLSAAIAVYCTE